MGAVAKGAAIGGAIDSLSGDDSVVDGAVIGAVTAGALKYVVVPAATLALGWYALHRLSAKLEKTLNGHGVAPMG